VSQVSGTVEFRQLLNLPNGNEGKIQEGLTGGTKHNLEELAASHPWIGENT